METTRRWWEAYVLRYFVGTAVGVATLMVVKENAAISDVRNLLGKYSDNFWKDILVLGSAGLAFCYIASAPVLTLHAVRGDWNLSVGSSRPWRPLVGVFLVAGLALTCTMFICAEDWRGGSTHLFMGMFLLVVIVVPQMWMLARALLNGCDRVVDFYRRLSIERNVESKNSGGYIESYRDLREHGNAKSIVLCEIILGYLLSVAKTKTQFICFLGLWMLPATCSWFIGTVLERRLTHWDTHRFVAERPDFSVLGSR